MCSILGYLSFRDKVINEKEFKKSLNLMEHRGPDNEGVYKGNNFLFGHRRLSIIDLSNHASQPMVSEDGNYILTFNGEIYNYIELKEELLKLGFVFFTNSDSEVLLKSYIAWGERCIDKFIGMFAFAIYDKNKNEFFIVRDRLGIKPLYYYKDSEKFIFSSEIKSILPFVKSKLNIGAISSYMSYRYPILNDTFFEDIFSLEPGNFIKIKNNKIEIKKYWDFNDKYKFQEEDFGEEYYKNRIYELLTSSVKLRMRSDVEFGAFLSGGVDSSAITALMAMNSKKRIKTFTIGFEEEGFNEFEYASMVAKQYNTEHYEIILSGENYIENMEKLIDFKDAPLSVPNEVPLYLMSKELKKYITVVLSGEGADEIFGGYGRIFRSPYDYERLKAGVNTQEFKDNILKKYKKDDFSNELEHFLSLYPYTKYEEKKKFLAFGIDEFEKKLNKKFENCFSKVEDYYNKIMYTFEKIHLPGLLHRVDTTTMATSVEARVPFVDHRVVEFAATIPIKYKLKWKKEKPINLMSDKISEEYDIPKYVLKKTFEKYLPKEVLYRKKMGFPVPLNRWFGGEFNSYAKRILLSKKAINGGIYNREYIKEILNSNLLFENHSLAMKIWMLINIELFVRKYFD